MILFKFYYNRLNKLHPTGPDVNFTCCTQYCPASFHSRGGRILLRISSVCCCLLASIGDNLPPFGGPGTGPCPGTCCGLTFNALACELRESLC